MKGKAKMAGTLLGPGPMARGMTAAAAVLLLAVLLAGCEQFFTYSPAGFLQRDPSNLPKKQKISYAESALESGDADTQRKAYEAIKDIDDPEVQLLASKVALGASGVLEAVGDAVEGNSVDISSVDMDMLKNSVDAMDNADGNTDISSEDYISAAAAAAAYAYEVQGNSADWSTVTADKNSSDYQEKAKYYQEQSGYTVDDMDQISSDLGL